MIPSPCLSLHAADPDALPGSGVPGLEALLDEGERGRLAGIRHPDVRRGFVAAHGLLRLGLAARTGIPPETFRLEADERGKPFLASPALPEPMALSLSHTRGRVACAFGPCDSVGIDVEPADRRLRQAGLSAHVCGPAEAAQLEALDNEARRIAFFRLWTLKEAFLKALGTGFGIDPRTVAFEADTGRILALPPEAGTPADWHVALVDLGPDHVAAWATRGPGRPQPQVALGWP